MDRDFEKGTCDDCIHEPEPLTCERCTKCKKFDLWEQGTQTCGDDRQYKPTILDVCALMREL